MALAALVALLAPPVGAREAPDERTASSPRCFGAASRDPEVPCRNPALRQRVTPLPERALLGFEAPCEREGRSTELCTFGAPADSASGTIGLYGDSHAGHYRAALLSLVARHNLRGISLTRPGCPFSLAVQALPEPRRSQCAQFNQGVIAYTEDRPEITTVFVSQSRAKVLARPGLGADETRIRGYVEAWDALPRTVRRVVVLRDPFYDRYATPDCVTRAHRQKRDAGRVCAMPRRAVLRPDPAVIAARRQAQRADLAVDVIDLTRFFCGARRCFPVVGGVLVHKDEGHITQLFGRTLGPYVSRAFERLAPLPSSLR